MAEEITMAIGGMARGTAEEQQAAWDSRIAEAAESASRSSVEATIYPDSDQKEGVEPETFMGEERGQLPGRRAEKKAAPKKEDAPKGEPAPAETRPDYIPEDQWKGTLKASYEAAASAAYLKKKQAEAAAKEAAKAPESPADASKPPAGPLGGLDLSAITNEIVTQRGKVSEETMKKLQATGLPQDVIDSHLAGYGHMLERNTYIAMEEAGGRERYGKVMEFFEKLPDKEKARLAPGFQSPDAEEVKSSAKIVLALYEKENGHESSYTAGGVGGSSASMPHFKSGFEKSQAFQDRRWYDESAPGSQQYREEVHAMIKESYRLGIRV